MLLTSLLVGFSASVLSPSQDDARLRQVAAIADACREVVASGDADGVSISVVVGGETLVEDGYGFVDGRRRKPARGDSTYAAASFYDTLLAAAIVALSEGEDGLSLDDPLSEHLSGYGFGGTEVRVHHLLEHTSGVPSYSPFVRTRGEAELDDVLAFLRESTTLTEPGSCYDYSNSNVLLATLLFRQVTGIPVDVFLEGEFERLKLEDTDFDGSVAPILRPASAGAGATEVGLPAPLRGGRLRTSARDLARWQRAFEDGDVVSEAAMSLMLAPIQLSDGSTLPVGLGFDQVELAGFEGHVFGGASARARLHVASYPSADFTIALQAPNDDAPLSELGRRISRVLFGLPDPDGGGVPIEAEELEALAGTYSIGCSHLRVNLRGGGLELVPIFGEPFLLLHRGEGRFVSRDDDAVTVVFELGEGGRAEALVLTDRTSSFRAVRVGD